MLTIFQSRRHLRITRMLLRAAALLALGLVVIVFAIAFWSRSQSRRWMDVQARYVASGETLDFESLLPAPIADDENFFAIPELRHVALVIDGDQANGKPAETRAAIEALNWKKNRPAGTKPPTFGPGPENGTVASLTEWSEYLHAQHILNFDAETGDAGADIIRAIDRTFPAIAVIAAQAHRKNAQFTPAPTERQWVRPMFNQTYVWTGAVFALSSTFQLRAEAAAQSHDSRAALESLRVLRHLATAAYQEPHYIGRLVAITCDAIFRRALWSAMRSRCLGDRELQQLQEQMDNGRRPDSLLYTLRTEMCFEVDTNDFLRGAGRDILAEPTPLLESDIPLWLARVLPDGWIDHNGAAAFEMHMANYIRPLKERGIPGFVAGMVGQERAMGRLRAQFGSKVMLAMVVKDSPVGDVVPKLCSSLVLDQQAVAAVALERFYLANHSYPESLDRLVPEFVSSVPVDFVASKPVGYRRTDGGRYMLWCVGFDGVDDSGVIGSSNVSGFYKLGYKGDWVWQYTPVKP